MSGSSSTPVRCFVSRLSFTRRTKDWWNKKKKIAKKNEGEIWFEKMSAIIQFNP